MTVAIPIAMALIAKQNKRVSPMFIIYFPSEILVVMKG